MKKIGLQLFPPRGIDRIVLRVAFFVFGAFGLMGAGCYPKGASAPGALSASSVTWASTRWPGVTESSLSAGRDLFLSKCNACHSYPDLPAIPDERWPHIIEKMAKKSDLGPVERDEVLHFVLASRSEHDR
jgi:hypothetical protein